MQVPRSKYGLRTGQEKKKWVFFSHGVKNYFFEHKFGKYSKRKKSWSETILHTWTSLNKLASLHRSVSTTLYHLSNWQATNSVWFMTHCTWLAICSCMRQKSGIYSPLVSHIDQNFFLPLCQAWHLQIESLAVTSTKIKEKKKTPWLEASLPHASTHI